MATTYPLPIPYVRLTIAGVDRTARGELIAKTLFIRSVLGDQIDTCQFSLKPPESWRPTQTAGRPAVGQSVTVEISTSASGPWGTVFGGTISNVKDSRIAFKTNQWDVECVDYTAEMSKVLVNRIYLGMNVSDIVRAVVREYAPMIIVGPSVSDCPTVIDRISFNFQYPVDIVTSLAKMVGWEWYVAPDRVLHFYDPAGSTHVSANQVTDTSNNFFDLSINPKLDQVRNRIVVMGGTAESQLITEYWDYQGTEQGRILLSHANVTAELLPSGSSPFLTINGVEQRTVLAGVDTSLFPGCWTLEPSTGEVMRSIDAVEPSTGDHLVFKYRYAVPISVVRESIDSMAAVAALEGTTYSDVVASDRPIYYWRLSDLPSTSTAANQGTAGVAYSGMYSPQMTRGVPGAVQADWATAAQAAPKAMIRSGSGVLLPRGSCTLEAWVKAGLEPIGRFGDGRIAYRELGIVGSFTTLYGGLYPGAGGAFLWLSSGGHYALGYNEGGGSIGNSQSLYPLSISGQPSGGGRFDHVVATIDQTSGARRLFVNNAMVAQDWFASTHPKGITGSGIEVGNYDYEVGIAQRATGLFSIDEVAVYDYVLSGSRVSAHYYAGRYGGVREAVLNDGNITTFEQARARGDGELAKWAAVTSEISFTSFVPGWTCGDKVTVATTMSGLGGRDFNGTATIQQVEIRWLGAQRAQWVVSCEASRFNWIDYQRSLLRTAEALATIQTTAVTFVRAYEATDAIAIAGSVVSSGAVPPFRIRPDWGPALDPSILVGYFVVTS